MGSNPVGRAKKREGRKAKMTEYGFIKIEYDYPETQKPVRQKMDRKSSVELVVIASILGFAILGFEYFSDLYVKLIVKTPFYAYYDTSEAMFNIIQAFFSLFAILIPFGIALVFIKLIRKKETLLPLNAPNSKKLFFASLAIAFLTLVISNFLVSVGVLAGEAIGFEFDQSEMPPPESFAGYLWQVLSVALVPAFVEEFAIRGVMLGALRKYGDTFAIIVSSIFFGLMHGNVMQAPFAMILGVVIGWLVIKTGSLWTGIAIHFMNNLYATSLVALGEITSTTVYVAIVAVVNVVGVLLGVYALVWLIDKRKVELRLEKKYKWEPYVCSLVAIPLLAAFVFLVSDCLSTVHYLGLLQ